MVHIFGIVICSTRDFQTFAAFTEQEHLDGDCLCYLKEHLWLGQYPHTHKPSQIIYSIVHESLKHQYDSNVMFKSCYLIGINFDKRNFHGNLLMLNNLKFFNVQNFMQALKNQKLSLILVFYS